MNRLVAKLGVEVDAQDNITREIAFSIDEDLLYEKGILSIDDESGHITGWDSVELALVNEAKTILSDDDTSLNWDFDGVEWKYGKYFLVRFIGY